jgi:hypothetical protein
VAPLNKPSFEVFPGHACLIQSKLDIVSHRDRSLLFSTQFSLSHKVDINRILYSKLLEFATTVCLPAPNIKAATFRRNEFVQCAAIDCPSPFVVCFLVWVDRNVNWIQVPIRKNLKPAMQRVVGRKEQETASCILNLQCSSDLWPGRKSAT